MAQQAAQSAAHGDSALNNNELQYDGPSSKTSRRRIRLLVLHASSDARSPIRCSFTYTALGSNRRSYEAISYAWGSATFCYVVWSATGNTSLPVTASAAAALRSVRLAHEDRVLWIDGLCINQSDDHEKAQQVALMGEIYGRATRTLVYLGEDEEEKFLTLVYSLKGCRSVPKDDADPEGVSEHPIVTARNKVAKKVGLEYKTATLDHITAIAYWAREIDYGSQDTFEPLLDFRKWFFARPWFSRLWMMQEIALSKRILFYFAGQQLLWGTIMAFHNVVDWESQQLIHDFYGHPLVSDRSILGTHIFENFSSDESSGPSGMNFAGEWLYLRHRNAYVDPPEEYYAQGRGRLSLSDHLMHLMYEMRHFHCKDPRDRLYAVLSLFENPVGGIPTVLQPNYHASNTPGKVYDNITRYLVGQGNYDVLAAAQGLPVRRPDLPSFAVNWEDPPDQSKLLTAKNIKPEGLRIGLPKDDSVAFRHSSQLIRHDDRTDVLVLRGMSLGELTYVSAFPYTRIPGWDSASRASNEEHFRRIYSCWMWWDKYAHSLSELGMSTSRLPSPESLTEAECWDEETIKQGEPLHLLPDFTDRGVQHYCEDRTLAVVGDVGISTLGDRDGTPIAPVRVPGSDKVHRVPKQLSDEDWEAGWVPTKARCLVPPAAEIGDLVCGILGCGVAVVLRPEDGGKWYKFVGMTTHWKSSISDRAPELDWTADLMTEEPPAPLEDFHIR